MQKKQTSSSKELKKVVEETGKKPAEAAKVVKLSIKCKGPKLKWDYSQYDDYPEFETKDIRYDPYEEDYVSTTVLNWRRKKRGFKVSPDENKK